MANRRRGVNARAQVGGVRMLGAVVAARMGTGSLLADPSPAHGLLLDGMPERELQGHIRTALEDRGWVVTVIPDMRMVLAGWPDLVAYHANVPGLLLCWELKTTVGRPTRKQRARLAHLSTVPGIDARIVRPRTWEALRDAIDSTRGAGTDALKAALSMIPKEEVR